MDLDSKPYRCFLAVARHRSFRRAAESLNVSQPALSATIAELERRLGIALFVRSSRTVALSTEGMLLLPSAERFIRETDIIGIAARDLRTNHLRIASPLFTSLVPVRNALIDAFEQHHTNIIFRIVNETPLRCLEMLASNETDLVLNITVLPKYYNAESRPRALPEVSANFEFQVLGEREIQLIVPSGHALAQHDVIPLAALNGAAVYIPGRYHGRAIAGVLRERFEEIGVESRFAPEGNALSVEHYAACHGALAVTLGWFGEPVTSDRVMCTRPVEGLAIATSLTLLRNNGPSRPGARAFWEFASTFVDELGSVREIGDSKANLRVQSGGCSSPKFPTIAD
jgi:DNA-binding transcriptional LysR family regulator